ncbi:MAG TPA: twin-arginine translocase TatA/TatE family subunit [Terriglobales bacterium]|nr:twin-arginine translocase TatA/TatE family subunit [Terriglobales bacterium]
MTDTLWEPLGAETGMPDIIFIVLLALIMFGPKKLPEIARHIGKYFAQFKRLQNELRSQLEMELGNIQATETAKDEPVIPPQFAQDADPAVRHPM